MKTEIIIANQWHTLNSRLLSGMIELLENLWTRQSFRISTITFCLYKTKYWNCHQLRTRGDYNNHNRHDATQQKVSPINTY